MARIRKPKARQDVQRQGKRLDRRKPHGRPSADPTGSCPAQVDIRAEESLREAEQRFRTIFDTTSDGIFLHDLETGKLTMGNQSCLQMLEYTPEEFMNLSVSDLHPEADLPFIHAQIDEFLKGGQPIRHDIRFQRKDGSIFFADVSPDLVRLEGKRYVLVAMKDITERKRVEETLAESERKYRSLVENIPDVTWTTDRQGRTLFISPNVRDVYGYSPEEIYAGGDTWLGNVHPDDRPHVEKAFRELFMRNKRYDVEYRIRRKEGNWIWLHDRSVSSYEKEGQWYADGVFSDVTERKHLEEELRRHAERLEELVAARTGELQESEARYRSLYHTVADGIFVVGVEGRIENVNDSACAQLGYARAELIGMPVAAISARLDFRVEEIFDRLRVAGSLSFETTHRRKDGGLVPVELSVTGIEYRGRPAALGVARDITERKRAEEALRFTQFAVDHTADAAFWMTEDARLFYVNEAACQALGYSCEELLQMTVYDIDPVFTESMWLESWRELQAKKSIVLETVHRARDGRTYPVEIRANYLEFGGRAYDCAFARDITERKQAEAALRASEERHRRLIENLKGSHFIYRHDTKGVFQYLSESLTGVLGYAPQEFLTHYGKYLTDHPANQAVHRHTELTLQGIPQPPYEINIWHKDGSSRWLEVQEVPVFDAEGRVIAVEGVAQDITERKQAEEALRESEERFRAAFEEGAVAMALTALDSTLLKVNSSFCRMFGFRDSELVGRSFTDITHPDDVAANLVGTRRLASGEISSFRMEKRYLRKDGTVIWGDMCTASVRDVNGRPLYCVTHVQDITDRKQAEGALRSLNERLEVQVAQRTEDLRHTVRRLRELTLELSQAEDRERQRIAGILHEDLQQTLAAARFHLNLLGSEPRGPAESQEIVEQVKQMLKDAIAKSRNLSHELSPAIYQVELTEILAWLARHVEQEYGLRVHVKAAGRADSSSEPLKALLYKVAQELLFNVVKHAHVNEAGIRVRRMGHYLCLAVFDRGCGFDPQELRKATGFGLLGIRERIQLLGGRMKIRSAPGAGSRVLIVVPDEQPSPVAALLARAKGWQPAQGGGTEGSVGVR
jgi:PAS domain S-box-containing protein